MSSKLLGPIVLDRAKRASLQAQLALLVKTRIQTGALAPGQLLPSTRELATDLAISRNTVMGAYDQLVSEGYLDPRPRAGLFVSESIAPLSPPSPRRSTLPPRLPNLGGPRPFRPCQPDVRLFPLAFWNRLRSRVLKSHATQLLTYQSDHALGWPALQRALANYMQESRSVNCTWDRIAVTSGSQQALYLTAQVLLTGHKRAVLVEDPCYPGALQAFRSAGANITPVPVDSEGILPPERIPQGALVYTTPSRQFPTGAVMTIARRLALLRAAHRASAWVIEDDYDSEFRYTRPPMPSLHSLDTNGRVIYIGSMSKALFPSLRIGYVALPPEIVDSFSALRSIVDDHGPLIDQATLAEFIASGALYSHIRRCRREYRARLDAFLETIEALHVPLAFAHTDGGMNLCGTSTTHRNDVTISAAAASTGLEVAALSTYCLAAKHQGLLFGFTAFDASTIRASLRRFAHL